MENNNKSQAEIYREERKARLAKEAAKKAKKSPKAAKAKKIAGKVIAIVLAVVIVLGAAGGILNFFGAPQKVLKVKAGDNKEYSFTLAEFNYYYFLTWANFQQAAAQYENYGEGMGLQLLGYDYTKAPNKQEYKDDYSNVTGVKVAELGVAEPTWADAFKYSAVNQLIQIKYGALKAQEAGITVTDEEKEELEETIKDIRDNAAENDYSLNRYLRATYGNGVSEKTLRTLQTESYLASSYFEKLQNDTENAVTEEQINEKYNSNKKDYDIASLRIYQFSAEEPKLADNATDEQKTEAANKAYAQAKDKANKFLAAVTDEASFIAQAKAAMTDAKKDDKNIDPEKADEQTEAFDITYADLEKSGEALAKWAYDGARAVGDKAVIDLGEGDYAVVLMKVLPHKDMSASSNNVRHILVKFPTDDNGNTVEVTDAIRTEYKAKAQAILDEYLKNPTEDNFAKLATEKTEDSGSKDNGGLYEDISKDSNYVENFLKWAIDPARKTGDTGIVETEYGYHVMYYVKANGVAWYETIKDSIVKENYSKVFNDLTEAEMAKINLDSAILNWTAKKQNSMIGNRIAMNYSK